MKQEMLLFSIDVSVQIRKIVKSACLYGKLNTLLKDVVKILRNKDGESLLRGKK